MSIGDGKKIMAALQNAVVNHEAETYAFFAGFAWIAIRSDRSRTTRHAGSKPSSTRLSLIPDGCCAGNAIPWMVGAFARLKEICPD
ncbi:MULTISPECIES: hypothetical protein [unclassified Mesorhizobium]|uniref:hypothetical protein n=1 Tax=unclassified Mesorhizobium TaxID=325217 RepID=UPI00333A58EC